jgi:hypothetical protein
VTTGFILDSTRTASTSWSVSVQALITPCFLLSASACPLPAEQPWSVLAFADLFGSRCLGEDRASARHMAGGRMLKLQSGQLLFADADAAALVSCIALAEAQALLADFLAEAAGHDARLAQHEVQIIRDAMAVSHPQAILSTRDLVFPVYA